ncbi:MAG TPA: hypothetical protein DCE56_33130 [Cyanobacteria bacterium UBA8553]|nr:hypothetical protein [Cyanobacteria bacterium UBA8553]
MVDFEGHGREELFEDADLSRTVGWFTSIFPLLLELENTADPGEALQSIKEQLRRIPNRGIGYGVLRYLSGNPEIVEQLQAMPQPEVSFNYLGQLDQVLPESSTFKPAREPIGSPYGLRGTRSHLLNISGFVDEGRLRMYWTYSDVVHQRRTIEQLAQSFMTHLRSLIAHCQAADAGGYTASDFPLLDLSQEELSAAFGRIRFEGG